MILQLLVARYQEPEEVIKTLLNSIAIQRGVDFNEFEVLICNDGTDPLPEEFFAQYPYSIKNITKEHTGIAGTRNKLLEEATADYVMYCDADDSFYTPTGLWCIIDNIKDKPFDIMYSNFVQETELADKPDKRYYLFVEDDTVFIHGKIYKREFLINNNIKCLEGVEENEESYFNGLAFSVPGALVLYCDKPFYLWCHNEKSLTRVKERAETFNFETYPSLIYNNDKLIEELIKKDQTDDAMERVINLVYSCWYNCNRPAYREEKNKEYVDKIELEIGKFLYKYKEYWDMSTELIRKSCYEKSIAYNQKYYGGETEIIEQFGPWATRVIGKGESSGEVEPMEKPKLLKRLFG